jgi:long-chain acyl-CoA synthetase
MNVCDLVLRTCSRQADRIALIEGSQCVTYGDLLHLVKQWAGHLIGQGGHPREIVGILAPNGIDYATALLGTLASGRAVLPLNASLPPEELGFILRDAGVETLIATKPLLERAEALRQHAPGITRILSTNLLELGPEGSGYASGDDLAVLLYTSGTTGRPKGVMLSHSNLLANVEGCLELLDMTGDDRFLAVLPFFHGFGLTTSLLIPLVVGASVEILPAIVPSKILQALSERGITCLTAVPSVYGVLARCAPASLPNRLRLAVAGGEPLPQRISQAWLAKFGVPLLEGYGTTETSPVITLTPASREPVAGSAGRPLPNLELRIAGKSGPLPQGETGEIQVRGPSVMKSYWNRPAETLEALSADGWYRTGDLGCLDGEGYLHLTGRMKELIISAGENIFPGEIEELLRQVPGVAEVAVVGVPDALRGEIPKAFVCPEKGRELDAGELREHLRGRLAEFKLPRLFEFRAELPRTATGKVLKRALA